MFASNTAPYLPGTRSKNVVKYNHNFGGHKETFSQKLLLHSIANFELAGMASSCHQQNCGDGDFTPKHHWRGGWGGSSRSVGCSLSWVTRNLVPKWKTYCFQFSIHAEIMGLNKDMTSYKSIRFFFGGVFTQVYSKCALNCSSIKQLQWR